MKKIIILSLVLLMVVVFATVALAKADVQKLTPYTGFEDASGKGIVNHSEGDVLLEITVSAKGLEAGTDYFVYIGEDGGKWTLLGTFTAKKNGTINFHRNIREDEDLCPLPSVKHMAINLAENNHRVLMDEDYF